MTNLINKVILVNENYMIKVLTIIRVRGTRKLSGQGSMLQAERLRVRDPVK
jgi:hypothetical protein